MYDSNVNMFFLVKRLQRDLEIVLWKKLLKRKQKLIILLLVWWGSSPLKSNQVRVVNRIIILDLVIESMGKKKRQNM